MKNTLDYAREALAALPAAVSGDGGHPATFKAACLLARFGLNQGDALTLLHEFNRRCSPPWSNKELDHKLRDAYRVAYRPPVARVRPVADGIAVPWKRVAPSQPAKLQSELVNSDKLTVPETRELSTIVNIPSERVAFPLPSAPLDADEIPWLHTANQIVMGEFAGSDRSTLKSLWYGVRGINHPKCQEARNLLESLNQ